MLLSGIPAKFSIPFAASAGAGYINTIPVAPSPTPGLASLTTGFPTVTFQPEASGGNPPYGADFNGILNWVTSWLQWAAAGGFPVQYDATFQTAIGGYPNGAVLEAASLGNGRFWISTVDNNTSNPDAGGANWMAFPDLAVQLQRPNYAVDSGTQNHLKVTLFPAPTSISQMKGVPVRVGNVAAANAINNPDIQLGTLTPIQIVNPDGSVLGIGQISAGCTASGMVREDGKFQLDSPAKLSAASTFPYPGTIIPWPDETVPSGWLELNGATLLMASYPNLFNEIGTRYGGDGVTTFKLPDWRGQFVRGWDHGRGLDPNAATRANAGGGITGDHVGTTQTGAAGPINLTGSGIEIDNPQWFVGGGVAPPGWWPFTVLPFSIPTGGGSGYTAGPAGATEDITKISGTLVLSGNSGAPETRPTNIYAMWIIKT